jgi:hypothetical protein
MREIIETFLCRSAEQFLHACCIAEGERHAADGIPWQTRAVEGRIQRISEHVDRSSLDGLRAGVEWLTAHLPAG